MTGYLHIVIAEPSDVIRWGICAVLTGTGKSRLRLTEVSRAESLHETLTKGCPDVVIVNPGFSALMPPAVIKKMLSDTKCVMLQITQGDAATAYLWDDVISPWDSAASIRELILRPIRESVGTDHRREPLSQREKDIVVCVVKSMTNKQIAERLNLSHHTVATHRRNISAKLDIHSTSGLTVYAISNKLVRLDELNNVSSTQPELQQ